ncbi:MAG: hypothetical protein WDN45_15495 [Caulobacteraceae bacterium]
MASQSPLVLHTRLGMIEPICVSVLHRTESGPSLGFALAVTVAGDTAVGGRRRRRDGRGRRRVRRPGGLRGQDKNSEDGCDHASP